MLIPSGIRGAEDADANGQTSTYSYAADFLDRLKVAVLPIGRREFNYDDATPSVTARERVTGPASDPSETVEKWREVKTEFDGFGRAKKEIQSGTGTGTVTAERSYDALGRVMQVWNPYEGAAGSQFTTTSYDALGRVRTVAYPDGSVDRTCYSAGERVVRDAAGKWKRLLDDGLGRITKVIEDAATNCDGWSNAGPGLATNYAYDANDKLTAVCQGGEIDLSGNCLAPGMSRRFNYDSLGRLTRAENPESGWIDYAYDLAGNLLTKTDARLWMTCFGTLSGSSCNSAGGYDDLGRPVKVTYSAASVTPETACSYDACANGKGRACSVSNSEAVRSYSYNAMGWVTASSQTVGATAFSFSYLYNEAGAMRSMTYPSGRVVAYQFDGLNRATRVASGATVYADAVAYEPHGAMRGLLFPGGKREQRCYNARLQLQYLKVGANALGGCAEEAGDLLRLEYGYAAGANNGNVGSQRIRLPGLDVTQTYQYDALNRISRVDEGSQFRTFGYSATGNMWVSGASAQMGTAANAPVSVAWFDAATNRLYNPAASIGYDSAGNLTGIGGQSFAYDAENRLKSSTVNGTSQTYGYDGEGRRVRAGTKNYIYDAAGEMAAEYGGASDEAGTQYLVADGLGSTRLVLDGSGGVRRRYDYHPFGEALLAGLNGRSTALGYESAEGAAGPRQRFTGKERDAETGLDFFLARYYSGAQGRFTSPDEWAGGIVDPFTGQQVVQPGPLPYADITDPQTLNKFVYVRNNPLRYVDPDGHDFDDVFQSGLEFVAGIGQGIAASTSFDAVGAPSPSDSTASRLG